MVSIKDVAQLANVSIATVSRVINSPERVSEKRRTIVLDAIKQLNYHPNDIARSLQRNESHLIGVLAPDISNLFTSEIISILSSDLEEHDYSMFLAITNHNPQKETRLVNLMLQKRVSGMILLGTRRNTTENDSLLDDVARTIPTLMVDYTNNCNMYCVRINEAAGISDAVHYLYDLGHRKIAFVNGSPSLISHYYKEIGYKQTMEELRLTDMAQKYTVVVSPDYAGGARGANMLLNQSDPPTAIVTGGDTIAVGVYYGIAMNGLSIPNDISVIGFSGSAASQYTYPSMTTVDQKPAILGSLISTTLIDILNGKTDVNRNNILEPGLLIRDSCRKI
ncbi:HTH-type transcriptional repressor CytR [Lachnospiraceae bacterium]|nr:LacI family transcriptional regulator [Eubacterium sp.]GFI27621.1 HTH-type transcriptional repressor CytR [Lachnospiraceae bacterium]